LKCGVGCVEDRWGGNSSVASIRKEIGREMRRNFEKIKKRIVRFD